MPEYTYRFADLLSDSDLCELELSNVRFDRRIIQAGAFSGTVYVTNSDIATQVKKIVPARTILHIYRDSDIWGSYIIWNMKVRSSSRGPAQVDLQGATLESWFDHRIVDVDLIYSSADRLDIARSLIDTAQTGWTPYEANANLGITYDTNDLGIQSDRSYYLTDAVSVGQRLQELANTNGGFEYMITTYEDPALGYRVRKFKFAQQLGGNSEAVFTYPGNILSYEVTYDASESATVWWVRGETIQDDATATEYPQMTETPFFGEDWLNNAFPHMDKVVDYPTIRFLPILELYARWWAEGYSGVVAVPVVEISTDDNMQISPALLGTTAQFTIVDEFFAQGDFTSENRVIGIEVTPPDRGNKERIRLVIEQPLDPETFGK